jgi:hypothetical protein
VPCIMTEQLISHIKSSCHASDSGKYKAVCPARDAHIIPSDVDFSALFLARSTSGNVKARCVTISSLFLYEQI